MLGSGMNNKIYKQLISPYVTINSCGWNSFAKKKILFIGGHENYPSVQIRCIQIAIALDCPYLLGKIEIENIPSEVKVLVLIKPQFGSQELEILSKRFILIWDLHDWIPEKVDFFHTVIFSTQHASNTFDYQGNKWIIPHHHCNFKSVRANPKDKTLLWVGREHWKPNLDTLNIKYVNVKNIDIIKLIELLQNSYIGINFRGKKLDTDDHIKINPGVKAINFMGFGVPSLSPQNEPAYQEWGSDGTIYCAEVELIRFVQKLLDDKEYYKKWSNKAFLKGKEFHIDKISNLYSSKILEIL